MYSIAKKSDNRKPDILYKVTIAFNKNKTNRMERASFRKEWKIINR
jgi:hypothetical protein